MRRHVPVFVLLALAVLAPAVVLVWFSIRSLPAELALAQAEERILHEQAVDAVADRIRSELDILLRRERERKYYEYSYFHALPHGQVLSNSMNAYFYNLSRLSGQTPADPLINGYFQMDRTGNLETPQILGNPRPDSKQITSSNKFLNRVRGFSKLYGQVQTKSRKTQKPQRQEFVTRQVLDANRNAKRRVEQIRRANQGDAVAQEEIQQEMVVQQEKELGETVEVDTFPFQVFTLEREESLAHQSGGSGIPITIAVRRVLEKDPEDPREYYQGFELNLGHLFNTTFPQAIAAVPAPNFSAMVVARSSEGDRSIVRDLGPLLPTLELRAGPAVPDRVVERAKDSHRRYQLVLLMLACIIAVALFLFWRLLRGEVELGRRRQDFVSAVTHELKTPLTSIRMYAELLEDRWVEDPDRQQEYFSTIRSESERLSRLIANVLDYSRLERGKRCLKRAQVDPVAAARDAIKLVGSRVEDRGGRLALKVADPLPPVSLDRDAFTQILINLVDNAVKYGTRGGDVDVTLLVRGEFLVLTVENQGECIPVEDRRRIFEDFRRGKGRREEEVSGVGLGLALVRRFAHAHGGTAECVESARPGARFQITFKMRG